jgi:hypothetical protein
MNTFTDDKKELFYIVFLIDSKHKDHDGKVFRSIHPARQFCKDVIKEGLADKIVIGCFLPSSRESFLITSVETYGFRKDKKNLNQLYLFKEFKPY